MKIQYTVTEASKAGVAPSPATVLAMIYEGDLAANFKRNKWWIPKSELTRLEAGLPLKEERRQEVMVGLLREDGTVIKPRSERLKALRRDSELSKQ